MYGGGPPESGKSHMGVVGMADAFVSVQDWSCIQGGIV